MDASPAQQKLDISREAHRKKLTRVRKIRKDKKLTEQEAQAKLLEEEEARKRCKEFGLKSTKKQSQLKFESK